MAAEVLARAGARVDVFDAAPSPLRKFLLAGRGGLNLTHAEPYDDFVGRYGAASTRLAPALAAFSPEALRAWAAELGEPTFVGSSGRVFPEHFKATRLARAWLRRLGDLGVIYWPRRRWTGLREGVTFAGPQGIETHYARTRWCSRWAERPGRVWAATAAGSVRSRRRGSKSRRWRRRTWGCMWRGRPCSPSGSPASRSRPRAGRLAGSCRAARPSSRRAVSKAGRSTRYRGPCAKR